MEEKTLNVDDLDED